jgi:hypothetical protein
MAGLKVKRHLSWLKKLTIYKTDAKNVITPYNNDIQIILILFLQIPPAEI